VGLFKLKSADRLKAERQDCAAMYHTAIAGCDWLTPQHVPDGYTHDYWTFAVATDTPERCLALLDAVERHGGERPYPAWRLTYREPAFRHLTPQKIITGLPGMWPGDRIETGETTCPVAESIQPRLVQFQTNNLASAERNIAWLSTTRCGADL
jgi:dTDP-4-amino-4,6-dideoxygalactose transaminase